jgi:hypothetical protein
MALVTPRWAHSHCPFLRTDGDTGRLGGAGVLQGRAGRACNTGAPARRPGHGVGGPATVCGPGGPHTEAHTGRHRFGRHAGGRGGAAAIRHGTPGPRTDLRPGPTPTEGEDPGRPADGRRSGNRRGLAVGGTRDGGLAWARGVRGSEPTAARLRTGPGRDCTASRAAHRRAEHPGTRHPGHWHPGLLGPAAAGSGPSRSEASEADRRSWLRRAEPGRAGTNQDAPLGECGVFHGRVPRYRWDALNRGAAPRSATALCI